MAIHDLFWACPLCGEAGRVRPRGRSAGCEACGARFRRGPGASIIGVRDGGPAETLPVSDWLRRVPAVETRTPPSPARVVLREATGLTPVHHGGELLGYAERFGPRRPGTFELDELALRFLPDAGETIVTPLESLTAIQASSTTLQIKRKGAPVLSARFEEASVLLWERLLQCRTASRMRALGRGEVSEWQPVIRVGTAVRAARPDRGRAAQEGHDVGGWSPRPARDAAGPTSVDCVRASRLYRTCQAIVRIGWRALGTLDVRGEDHLPATGPFLLVCNHQSDLDPLIIQAVIRRPVHTVAKSTLFRPAVLRWLLPRINAFPVRRYQADPQAVRVALRRLRQGCAVGIFIEGERSWDGALQDPKPGTVRLVLKAGVPVVPCTISGAYDASPRWASGIRPGPVRVTFHEPMQFPALDRRADRERIRHDVATQIMAVLASGLDAPTPADRPTENP